MKMLVKTCRLSVLLFAFAALFQGCLKDTATRSYTLYQPVYKTVAEVRANIKSNVSAPVVTPGKIFVQGNYIFLNEIDKGVHIIDNTNPSSPINKYFVSIPGNLDLAVKGNTLYADNYRDLITLDISNPSSVQVKKITENVFPARQYLNGFIADSTKVITDWITKDTTILETYTPPVYYGLPGIYLLNSASAPVAHISTAGISGSMARFTLLNNYLYTVTSSNLNVFNIATPENPIFENTVPVGWNIETIYPFKNNLFIGSQSGMFVYGTSNPSTPQQLAQFTHATRCDPVIADDNFAYVTLSSGTTCRGGTIDELDIVNIQDLNAPWLIKSYPLTNPHGLSKSGQTLIVCDGTGGVKIFDATDVANLRLLSTMKGLNAQDVITQNDHAIVVAKDGLYQYDYTSRTNVTLLSKMGYGKY